MKKKAASSARSRTALVAGGTGLVGTYLLLRLVGDGTWKRVVSAGRRAADVPGVEPLVVDPREAAGAALFPTADDAFCALGTTIGKAGSKEAFRAVDFDLVVAFAKAALAAGAKRLVVVSSLGADPRSSNFYLRVKGETEEALASLGFGGLALLRPSLLLGNRKESRPAERAAIVAGRALSFAFVGPLARYRPVEADALAAAMVALARGAFEGRRVVESEEITPRGVPPSR